MMDLSQLIMISEMILKLTERIGELQNIWKRALTGEKISDDEIKANQAKVDAAVAAWDASK